eukprot:9342257-Lingulodinium_polyedra.AAC.1
MPCDAGGHGSGWQHVEAVRVPCVLEQHRDGAGSATCARDAGRLTCIDDGARARTSRTPACTRRSACRGHTAEVAL